jgi:uncharacterized repeat protein (TIGR01451 family)
MARMLISPRSFLLAALLAASITTGTASASTPACTISGTDRSETLTGTAGRDVICGKGGNDKLRGLGGDDVLLGGDGSDTLEGGAGNDDLQGEKGNDALTGGDGNDSLAGGEGNDVLGGGSGADTAAGDKGNDRLEGGDGVDSLAGGEGHDVAFGGGGNDSLSGGSGHDGLAGGEGDDAVDGGDDADVLDGGAGADTVLGGGGDDLVAGSGGKDTLDGGPGTDAFLGGADADVVKAKDDRRDAVIDCGAGKDSLSADAKDPKARDCEGAVVPPPPPAPKADLSVSLTDSADPVVEATAVEYHYSVANAGPAAATGVTVATSLPAGATADPATGCTAASSVVTCALPDVPSGGTAAGTLVVRYASTGSKSVTSVVHSAVEDSNAANDTVTQTTQVNPKPAPTGADLSVAVTGTPGAVAQLVNVSYATDVTNAGPLAADAVSLVFDIDESWNAIARPVGCTQSMFPTTKVTCSLGSLAAGATVNKVLGVSWGEAGDQTVVATVSSTTTDPTAANNSETEHTSVS